MDSTAAAQSQGEIGGELAFASALAAAEAIRAKKISSVELTRHIFERIDRYNPALNAFCFQIRDEALEQAKRADEALARGESLGVFHGVPIHVKESFGVAGQPCTWGVPAFKDSKAPQNAEAVERLIGAGALLIGGTNVPLNLHDWQSYNAIYGRTNNPYDVGRSPGGSSGGSAAALAAGLGYLSMGSDIGGSIRVPSNFCGIYGHKPTLDLVSQQGHQVGGSRVGGQGFSTLLAVVGPMARSAEDLLAALKIVAGPIGWDAKAWKWELPPARAKSLKDFRVGYVIDDPISPPTREVAAVLENAIEALGRVGAKLKSGWPAPVQVREMVGTYLYMLGAFIASMTPEDAEGREQTPGDSDDPFAAGARSTFREWQQVNIRRVAYRAQWQAYFGEVDVFLSPVTFTAAFPHDHSEPQSKRTVATAEGPRRYMEMMNWIAGPSLTGCPATVAPVGVTRGGLPVGMQIMGPYWEDATPITFAELLAREIGGFSPPRGYES